ncbi:MAG: hypothetical protein OCD02_02400 [Spirochaetaceae bacterium]
MKQLFTLTLLLLLLSCNKEKLTILTLNTNLPEVVPFIEEFNRQNRNIKILLESTLDSEKQGDLVIFKGDKSGSPYKTLNIQHMLNKQINSNLFYVDLLESTMNSDGSIDLLPLTFDVSGLIYNKINFQHERSIKVENFIDDHNLKFSPYWDTRFIIWYYLANLPNFDSQNSYFDNQIFKNTILKTNNFLSERTDDWNEDIFNNKYLHLSPELLLNTSKIDYYYLTFCEYIKLNTTESNIMFSFLSTNDLILTNDFLTYIGITKQSKNKKKAEDVLTWMFNEKNQENFIKANSNRSATTNLLNGELSTLKNITINILPKYYPGLKKLIPQIDIFTVPKNLPPLWNSLKDEVFIPLLKESKSKLNMNWQKKYDDLYEEWSKKHNK